MNQDNGFNQESVNLSNPNEASNNQNVSEQITQQNQVDNFNNLQQGTEQLQNLNDTIQNNYVMPTDSQQKVGNNLIQEKKKKIGVKSLFVLGAVIVVVAVVSVIVVLLNGNSSKTQSDITYDNIVNGEVKLVATSNARITAMDYKYAYNYFETKDENGNKVILDSNGKEILKASYYRFLSDNYVLYRIGQTDEKNKIFDLKQKKDVLEINNFSLGNDEISVLVKNDIIYYNDYDSNFGVSLTSYDLKSGKKLWTKNVDMLVDQANKYKYGITDKYILVNSNNYNTKNWNKLIVPSVAIDFEGKVVVDGNSQDISKYDSVIDSIKEKEIVYTYVTKNEYYIQTKYADFVSVYDFKHQLISTVSLKTANNNNYYLTDVFDNGMFVVMRQGVNDLTDSSFVLYDIYGKKVYEKNGFSNISSTSTSNGMVFSSEVLVLSVLFDDYLLIKDNKVAMKVNDFQKEKYTGLTISSEEDENNFLIVDYYDNDLLKSEIINLHTFDKIDNPLNKLKDSFFESPSGKYIILDDMEKHIVYDSKFNLKYQSDNSLYPINDNFIMEVEDNRIYVVNLDTNKKNEISIKGKFIYDVSAGGMITVDENNKYYLYAFN